MPKDFDLLKEFKRAFPLHDTDPQAFDRAMADIVLSFCSNARKVATSIEEEVGSYERRKDH